MLILKTAHKKRMQNGEIKIEAKSATKEKPIRTLCTHKIFFFSFFETLPKFWKNLDGQNMANNSHLVNF